jgi:hypothetical protein
VDGDSCTVCTETDYCRTCLDDEICLSCFEDSNRYLNPATNKCECKEGYTYLVGTVCTVCPYKCATCNEFGVCSSCNGLFRDDSTSDCNCKAGYFEVAADENPHCQ